ncbi:H-NS histone family protein [Maribrevibacterium harenarium]|uniref:H-NS histone family protein n=1 Tax=Maribrevibacterium harenarium TaxID=2589817 RepID=A0A501X3A4_9GAMM|nr:H-NS histone family protein [Maribrevibacterium harenarium]TPE54985.1 H-NS histone family protein [Maribrevibacterium harenarium]
MSLLEELAGNKAKARAAAKELSIPQLENLIAGFNDALAKLKEMEEQRLAEEAEKTQKAEQISRLIEESGLTLEEIAILSAPRTANPIKGKTVAPKYRIEWNGETHEWTGRGRTPKVFAEYFAAGNSRESAEI